MTVEETIAPPARLAFGVTFRAAFSTVFKPLGSFVKLAAVPILLSSAFLIADFCLRALSFTGILVFDDGGLVSGLLQLVIGLLILLPFSLLGIGLTRQRHIGPQAGWLPSPALGRRTWVYSGYLLLLLVIFIVLIALGAFTAFAVLDVVVPSVDARAGVFILGGFSVFSLLAYLMLRLSLVLPAVALDQKLGLMGSWRLTRGSGVKLLGIILLLFLVQIVAILIGSVLVGSGEVRLGTPELVIPEAPEAAADWAIVVLANLPRNLWNLAANIVIFAMSSGALASAYVQLSSWGATHHEILERFD